MFKRVKGKKYNNVKICVDGIKFDSKKESQRYLFLKNELSKKTISNLELQTKYVLVPSIKEEYVVHLKTKDKIKTRTIQHPITYTCDFKYEKDGETIVEDVKASPKMLPKEYILKKKMMLYFLNIKIKEVYKPTEAI